MAAVSFLQVQDVTHTYFSLKEKTAALENVSIEVEKGEFVSFLGPSGCGKTTLLSIIAGIVSPTEGRVLVEGRTPDGKDRHIGYMLQQDYLFPWKTIEENVLIGLHISKKLGPETKETALGLLKKFGLYEVEKSIQKSSRAA